MRIACFLLFTVAVYAESLRLPAHLEKVATLAHASPAEFASDALLQIAERGGLAKPAERVTLIEEAFRLAASAQFKMPFSEFHAEVDSNIADLNQAYRLRLDSLSLQTRAVRDLINLDNAKARELFTEIPPPAPKALACEDALVPDVSAYYDALGLIFNNTFSATERAKEEHINFLMSYLAQVSSPVQLTPMAHLIKGVGLNAEQRDAIVGRFNAILENMQGDDRSVSAIRNELQAALAPEMSTAFAKFEQRSATGKCKESDAKVDRYWQSDKAKQIYQLAQKLRAARGAQDWSQQLEDFLKELNSWTSSDESSENTYFHQRSIVYEALMDMTPRSEHPRIVAEFIGFLNSSNLQQQSPVEWFLHAKSFYERIHNTNPVEGEEILVQYQESGNPVLSLYTAVQAAFASQLPSWAVPATAALTTPR